MKNIVSLIFVLFFIVSLSAQTDNGTSPAFERVSVRVGNDLPSVQAGEINKSIRVYFNLSHPELAGRVIVNVLNNDNEPAVVLLSSDIWLGQKDGLTHFRYPDPITGKEIELALKRGSAMVIIPIGALMHHTIKAEVILFDRLGNEVGRELSEIH